MCVFFFNDTATTEIYTLSLHDALPIYLVPLLVRSVIDLALAGAVQGARRQRADIADHPLAVRRGDQIQRRRSEEHTSELQSRQYLVCRLLLEKKNNRHDTYHVYG